MINELDIKQHQVKTGKTYHVVPSDRIDLVNSAVEFCGYMVSRLARDGESFKQTGLMPEEQAAYNKALAFLSRQWADIGSKDSEVFETAVANEVLTEMKS